MGPVIVRVFCTDFLYLLRKKCCNMEIPLNEGVLRVCLIVFSIIFGILSLFLIGLGIAYFDEVKWPEKYADLHLLEMPSFLITIGSLSLALSIVGCYCAKSYRRMLFRLFIICLCILLAMQLFVAIVAFNYNSAERKSRTLKLMQEETLTLKTADIYFKKIEDHVSFN